MIGEEVINAPYDHSLTRPRDACLLEVVQTLLLALNAHKTLLDELVLLYNDNEH